MEKEDRLLAQRRIVTFDGDRVRIVELSNPTDTSIISDLLILFFSLLSTLRPSRTQRSEQLAPLPTR